MSSHAKVREPHKLYPKISNTLERSRRWWSYKDAQFVSKGTKRSTCSTCHRTVIKRKWRIFAEPDPGFADHMIIVCVPCYQEMLGWYRQEEKRYRDWLERNQSRE